MVAQVYKEHATVIANAMAPAGKADRFIGVRFAEIAAGVCTITMNHVIGRRVSLWQDKAGRCVGRRAENRMGSGKCQGATATKAGSQFNVDGIARSLTE
jgi:hypothetical protein